MILKSLRLKNFKSHRDTYINFSTMASPVLIKGINIDRSGSNGAGKSSIFDGIEYALYGKTSQYLQHGKSTGSVELEFIVDSTTFKIQKIMTTDSYSIDLYKDGVKTSQSKVEVEKFIRQTLKISKRLFDQTIFQAQGFNQFFGLLSPKMKSEFIMELLDIDRWRKYYDVAKSLSTQLSKSTSKFKVKMEMLTKSMDELKEIVAGVDTEKLKSDIASTNDAIKQKEEVLTAHAATINNMNRKVELKSQLDTAEGNYKLAKNSLDQSTTALTQQKTILDNLKSKKITAIDDNYRQALVASSLNMEKYIASLEHEVKIKTDVLQKYRASMQDMLSANRCPMCDRALTGEEQTAIADHVNIEIQKQSNELTELTKKTDAAKAKRVKDSEELATITQQAVVYAEHIRSKEDVESKIAMLSGQVRTLETQVQAFEKSLASLKEQWKAVESAENVAAERKINDIRGELDEFKSKLTRLTGRLSDHLNDTRRVDSYASEIGVLENDIQGHARAEKILRSVGEILSPNGIQRWLFTTALGEIATLANSLLRVMNYSVIFQMERQKKSGEGFKPTFDIMVKKISEDRIYGLELLSGGERSTVNFAIRLAFSTIMATKYGFRFMIIDEGFTDLDDKAREIIGDMIKLLANKFQIFVVTHFPDLEDMFENLIIVEKRDGISKVLNK